MWLYYSEHLYEMRLIVTVSDSLLILNSTSVLYIVIVDKLIM